MFDNHSFCLLVTDLGSRSRSPASSPDNKLMSPTRTTSEQKPFRGFDITSLIRKDDEAPAKTESAKDSGSLPSSPNNNSSPTMTRGPPIEKSSNPYAGLFGSSLYQQYLGQLLSSHSQASQFPGTGPGAPPFSPFHPMLLQAQLAMAAQSQGQLLGPGYPGVAGSVASSMLAERLKQHRFSPYSRPPSASLNTSMTSPTSSSGPSAFRSLTPKSVTSASSPPVSPPSCASPSQTSLDLSTSPGPVIKTEPKNDIKNIESMIQGLNGSTEGRFSLSHDLK